MLELQHENSRILVRVEDRYIPEPNSGCWLWIGAKNLQGYGMFRYRYKGYLVHRKLYEVYKGEIPKGLHVLHTCDVRCCVNPDHMFLGTHQDNMEDRGNKGRSANGSKNGRSKLKEDMIETIRDKYSSGNYSSYSLGIEYGVAHTTILNVVRNKTWRNNA